MRKSNDKSKNSHIERAVYVSRDVKPGDEISYGDTVQTAHAVIWHKRGEGFREGEYLTGQPLTIIEVATGSDYSGNLVERSNYECLKEEFPWLVTLYGGHGTFGVGYLGKRENQNDRLIEAIDALAERPIYSDDHHSNLEMETVDEQWCESHGGRYDWVRALCKFFDEIEPEHNHCTNALDNDLVDTLWRDCCEMFRGGEEHLNEQGDSIYFPIDDVIEAIERRWDVSKPYGASHAGLDKATYSYGDNRTIREKLEELCEASRDSETQTATEGA